HNSRTAPFSSCTRRTTTAEQLTVLPPRENVHKNRFMGASFHQELRALKLALKISR
ncbi:MAG: hypothetical protein JWN11_2265, partial [Hyphomicrobiales bacterium]|nr:hypothetical protein [Hyphomicrobiales bacterium]